MILRTAANLALAFQIDFSAPGRDFVLSAQFPSRLPINPTLLYQLMLVAAIVLVVRRWKSVREAVAPMFGEDWHWLAYWSAAGLILRLIGGIKVPAHVKGHGYEHMYDLLFGHNMGIDYHGNGNNALFELLLLVLPQWEITVVIVTFIFSLATIPAVYVLSRLWFGSRDGARAAAAITAVFPVFVFYAASEERYVTATFFVICALSMILIAMKDGSFESWAASALLVSFAAQFQPFLRLLPVVAAFMVLSMPEGRRSLLTWKPWAAGAMIFLLTIDTVIHDYHNLTSSEGPGAMAGSAFDSIGMVFRPSSMQRKIPGNSFLDPSHTPRIHLIFLLAGVAAGIFSRRARWPTVMSVFAGLLLTVPSIMLTSMNNARMQIHALPFYIFLTGNGLGYLTGAVAGRFPRGRLVGPVLMSGAIAASAVAWPGQIGTAFTPHLERRFIMEGLKKVDEGCTIIWPSMDLMSWVPMPMYMTREQGRDITWHAVRDEQFPGMDTECVIYYRPAACWDLDRPEKGAPRGGIDGMRTECARFEGRMILEPLHTGEIPASGDSTQKFSRNRLQVGFYRARPR